MEVTIKNAFLIFVRLSWKAYATSLESSNTKVLNAVFLIFYYSLQVPTATTLAVSTIALFLLALISISSMIVVGVMCAIVVIIMIEGIFFLILATTLGITMAFFAITLVIIVKLSKLVP